MNTPAAVTVLFTTLWTVLILLRLRQLQRQRRHRNPFKPDGRRAPKPDRNTRGQRLNFLLALHRTLR